SQNVVHSDSDLILHNSSVLIDKEPKNPDGLKEKKYHLDSYKSFRKYERLNKLISYDNRSFFRS
ncbi:hypothetical protein EWU59_13905, partial [Enterococcus faecium]